MEPFSRILNFSELMEFLQQFTIIYNKVTKTRGWKVLKMVRVEKKSKNISYHNQIATHTNF